MKKNISFYKTSLFVVMILFLLQNNIKAQGNTLPNGIYFLNITYEGQLLYLDANASQQNQDQGQIELWNFNGNPNQKWRITQLPNGFYTIKLLSTGLCLDAYNPPGSPIAEGTIIQLFHYQGSNNQQWEIDNISDNTYAIKSPGTNLCIEANANPNYDLRYKNGCRIDLWEYQGTANHIWTIKIVPTRMD